MFEFTFFQAVMEVIKGAKIALFNEGGIIFLLVIVISFGFLYLSKIRIQNKINLYRIDSRLEYIKKNK